MGGRGASAGTGQSGQNASLSQDLKRILGRKGKPKDLNYVLKNTNPHYGEGKTYSDNCQRCAPVAELVERGYNVEAQPYQYKNDPLDHGQWMHMFKGQTWVRGLGNRKPAVEAKIKQIMSGYGDGARAIVYVAWDRGAAHVFNVRQENGQTIAYDAQTGRIRDLTRTMAISKPTKTMISRVDNLEPDDNFKYAAKKR